MARHEPPAWVDAAGPRGGLPWARYERLSTTEAREDKGKSKAERMALTHLKLDAQREETTDWLDEHGLPYADDLVFRDAALSASRANVVRPGWNRMMELAEAGKLGGIAAVASDRFTRDLTTMEEILKLAEKLGGLNIGGPRVGDLDLTSPEGIMQFRGMTLQAANEALITKTRIKGTLKRKMKAGKPMGGGERCFGFEMGGQVQRPDEAEILLDYAVRAIAGVSFELLADELNDKGITTVQGFRWTGPNLGKMLGRHRYGGFVEHHGEIVGVIPGDPVLDLETYDALQGMLASRRRGRRPTGKFLLTGYVSCSKCKRAGTDEPLPMNGKTRSLADGTKVRDYRCSVQLGGCGRSIMAKPVEEIVGDHMVKLLSDPKHAAEVVAQDAYLDEARSAKLAELVEVEEQVIDLTVKWTAGELGRGAGGKAAYDQGLARLNRRRAKLGAALGEGGELSIDRAIKDYDAELDWAEMTPDQKRGAIRRHGVTIMIEPQPPGRRWFTPERVVLP